MAEYSREQTSQLSLAVAKSKTESRQLKGFVDNRISNIIQMKTLIISKSFQNNPVARNDGKLGLGEKLILNAKEEGEAKVGEGIGAPIFLLESGTSVGQLNNNEFFANGVPGRVEFSVKRSDEDDGLKSKISMDVIAPQSAHFVNTPPNHNAFKPNEAGAGFDGNNTIYEPTTVSFNGLDFREGVAPLSSNGAYSRGNGDMHDKTDPPITVNEKNLELSCDTVNSDPIDETTFNIGGPGDALWPIPWEYSIMNKNRWVKFMTANHLEHINNTATVTMSKLNGTSIRTPPKGTWVFP